MTEMLCPCLAFAKALRGHSQHTNRANLQARSETAIPTPICRITKACPLPHNCRGFFKLCLDRQTGVSTCIHHIACYPMAPDVDIEADLQVDQSLIEGNQSSFALRAPQLLAPVHWAHTQSLSKQTQTLTLLACFKLSAVLCG